MVEKRKQINNPIGQLGRFKPIYLETSRVDERDGLYCKIVTAEFWEDSLGRYGELLVQFVDSKELLTVGVDEFEVL